MPKPQAIAYYLACSAHLQTESAGGAPYTFLFKWMLTNTPITRTRTDLDATDVVLPATGDVYTLSLIDEATQTQIFPAVGAPACNITPQNDYKVATFEKVSSAPNKSTILDQPVKIAKIIDQSLADLAPSAVAYRASECILSKIQHKHEKLDSKWIKSAQAPTEAFTAALHPIVAKHFRGRYTDMKNGARMADGPFTHQFDDLYRNYRKSLQTATQIDFEEEKTAEAALLEAILTAIRDVIAVATNQHSYLVMSAASGTDLQPSQGGSDKPSMGAAFGLETVIPLDPALITTPGTTGFKKITVRLALTNSNPGQEARNLTADFKDCLATAHRLRGVAPPQSYIIEDGWFSEPDGNATRAAAPSTQSAVFHPTCGDGAVQICVSPTMGAFPHAHTMTEDGFTAYTLFRVGVAVDESFDPNTNASGTFFEVGQFAPYTPSNSGAPLPSSTLRTLRPREAQVQLRTDPATNAVIFPETRNYVMDPTLVRPILGTPYYFWSRAKQSNGLWSPWLRVKRWGADRSQYGLDAPAGISATTFKVLASSPIPPTPTSQTSTPNVGMDIAWDVDAYRGSVTVQSVSIKDANGDPLSITFNMFHRVSHYRVLLLAKVLELNWAGGQPAPLRGQTIDPDLSYLQQSLWYANLMADGWLFVSLSDEITPAADNSATVISLGRLPPGYSYQAVLFAKRDPNLCYRVPDGQPGRNAFPSAAPKNATSNPGWPPTARPRQLASPITDRIIPLRFDISEPTFTRVVDATMQDRPEDTPQFSPLPPTVRS